MFVKLDEALVARACGGDDSAAAELIQTVWPDAYRIAWSILRDRPAAEDAAQEACARAWSGLRGLRRSERFAVWFCRIVVNESKRIQQKGPRDAPVADVPANDAGVLDERIAVRAAVDALEPRLRLPILLRYYYGLRSAEIAQVLDASAVTVRWWLMLGHRRLATTLDDNASHATAATQSDGRYTDESVAAS